MFDFLWRWLLPKGGPDRARPSPLAVTPRALAKIKALMREAKAAYVRVAWVVAERDPNGRPAAFQRKLDLVGKAEADDHILDYQGLPIVMDPASYRMHENSNEVLDYEEQADGTAGFLFRTRDG